MLHNNICHHNYVQHVTGSSAVCILTADVKYEQISANVGLFVHVTKIGRSVHITPRRLTRIEILLKETDKSHLRNHLAAVLHSIVYSFWKYESLTCQQP